MAREKLAEEAVREALAALDGWSMSREGTAIARTLSFRNFSEAFGFMTQVALAAERLDHHPDWSNVYKTVTIELTTHDAGGLSARDVAMVEVIEGFV